MRSWLFVPADSERKLGRAAEAGADVLILDLEDSVVPDARPRARAMVGTFLGERPGRTWVRVNPVGSADGLADLAAVVRHAPDGLVVPKATPDAMAVLSAQMDALEAREGLAAGAIALMPVATETPGAVLALPAYAGAGLARMVAMTWGAEDLAAELGAAGNRAGGAWDEPYGTVRAWALLAARAAGVEPVETLWADFRDLAGLEADTRAAARQGFTGRLAIHPGQVPVINAAMTPDADAVAWAGRVVTAFAGGAGVASLDGRMLDRPHLRAAERVLARAAV